MHVAIEKFDLTGETTRQVFNFVRIPVVANVSLLLLLLHTGSDARRSKFASNPSFILVNDTMPIVLFRLSSTQADGGVYR